MASDAAAAPGPHASALGEPPASPSAFERRVVGFLVKTFLFRGRRGGPWAVPEGLPHTCLSFKGNSGATLVGVHVLADQPRGIVVLAHPDKRYGKHWFFKHGWAQWLRGNGFDSLLFDFPVYGESHGGSTYLNDDVLAACRKARELRPDLPVHVIGLSVGAFATVNAAPHLDFVESMVLESPYPDFQSWYAGAGDRAAPHETKLNSALAWTFPKTYRYIHAGRNVALASAKRILILGTSSDEVTPVELTRQVAAAAPKATSRYLEVEGEAHLGLFGRPDVRAEILSTLAPGSADATRPPRAVRATA